MKCIIAIAALALLSCGKRYDLPDGRVIVEGDYCPCRGTGWTLVCIETGLVDLRCTRDTDDMCRWLPPEQAMVTGGSL